jgi:hypothetical protein
MPHYRLLLNEVFGTAATVSRASDQLTLQSLGNAPVVGESDRNFGGFALRNGAGYAYNEEAFQYFLEIERKRSELSNCPFLLMLVDFNSHPRIEAATADKLFSVLALSLRETDFIGWYREGRVAGAVLTQHGEADGEDLADVVRGRVGAALRRRLPSDLGLRLQVRLYQIPAHIASPSQ